MRHPPSFGGLLSQPVRLKTDDAMRIERARLERETREAQAAMPGVGEREEMTRPELWLF